MCPCRGRAQARPPVGGRLRRVVWARRLGSLVMGLGARGIRWQHSGRMRCPVGLWGSRQGKGDDGQAGVERALLGWLYGAAPVE